MVNERQLQVNKPRLRRKGRGAGNVGPKIRNTGSGNLRHAATEAEDGSTAAIQPQGVYKSQQYARGRGDL